MSQQMNRQPSQDGGRVTIKPHVIGAGESFAGRIVHAGRVEVWGIVRGMVRALEISVKNGGKIDGQAEANLIKNDGTLSGTVRAMSLQLSKRSRTEGEIKVGEIGTELGARFSPNTQLMTPDPKMIAVLTPELLSAEITQAKAKRSRQRLPQADEEEVIDAVAGADAAGETRRPYLVRP